MEAKVILSSSANNHSILDGVSRRMKKVELGEYTKDKIEEWIFNPLENRTTLASASRPQIDAELLSQFTPQILFLLNSKLESPPNLSVCPFKIPSPSSQFHPHHTTAPLFYGPTPVPDPQSTHHLLQPPLHCRRPL